MEFHKLLCFCLLLNGVVVYGQQRKSVVPTIIDFKSGVQIDGDLSDWGDSLRYYYEKQDLQFEIANDERQLYVAMRVKDPSWQMQALHQGFNLVINKDGKKKDGASITFPVPDRESLRALAAMDKDERPADMRQGVLNAVRAVFVSGMADVVDGPVSLENNYGIKAAVSIDSLDAVCYEAVIPFDRLGLTPSNNKETAFNVKINGIVMRTVGGGRPMGRYGYGGYGYPYANYNARPTRKEAQQEPGMWFVLPLANLK
ncbi:hypothetical protein [Olivibacter sp. XZL3]|uniref:hypothetical protein n=1 Tax=Olivibacter sp. XZL3 TaxID=1735116 RepID=UPI0010657B80|nr:hypothetical protein [Olivibacter sp. XZL3]